MNEKRRVLQLGKEEDDTKKAITGIIIIKRIDKKTKFFHCNTKLTQTVTANEYENDGIISEFIDTDNFDIFQDNIRKIDSKTQDTTGLFLLDYTKQDFEKFIKSKYILF
jgi:hypothetical protein